MTTSIKMKLKIDQEKQICRFKSNNIILIKAFMKHR